MLPGGHFSGFAADGLKVGDELEVMTPTGGSTPGSTRRTASTTARSRQAAGITPILSIVATALEREPDSTFTLIYANRTSRTVMFLEELEDLKDRYPGRFHLIHVLSREAQDAELLSGRLDAAAADQDHRDAGAGRHGRRVVPLRAVRDGGRPA